MLLAVGPFLLGTDFSPARDTPRTEEGEKSERLRQFIHEVDGAIDAVVDELMRSISRGHAERIRRELYSWRLDRESTCRETTRDSSDPLAELECVSMAAEESYQARRIERDRLLEAETEIGSHP